MQRPQLRTWKIWATAATVLAALGLVTGASTGHARAQTAPPATTLGIWLQAEGGGTYSTIQGQSPNVANTYLYWGHDFPAAFAGEAHNAGATPFVEIEPWQGVTPGNAGECDYSQFPAMTTIGANGSAISSYLHTLGSQIASFGHPVIITFAHEFNISGQYPWAQGDCENTTPAQWIQAWDTVRTDINTTAAGFASFMWAPGADTGGTNQDPTAYWPGASEVDMVGVDGYPNTRWGQFTSFSALFGPVFSEIHALTSLPIFIAETDLAPLDGTGYESLAGFVSDLCSNGGDGLLQYQDDTPDMTATQWTELDNALSSDCSGSTTPPGQAPAVVTGSASSITTTSATLAGTVNPEGAATTYQFQYGTSTSYGSLAPAPPASAGSGGSATSVSAEVSGLTAGTTYDYRLVATNATGTTEGSNQTFTTPATPPPGGGLTPVGDFIYGASLTPSVTTHAAGDVILLHVTTEGNAPPTTVTGGDATWKQVGSTLTGNVNSGLSAAVFEGTVTTAGTAQATVTTSGTASAVRIAGQEYNPGSGQTAALISQATLDNSGTNTGPSITPTGTNELYSFYGFDTDIGTAGSTPGYTYDYDDYGNVYAFDPASPAQPPTFGDSNVAFGIAVLMESAPAGSS
ncbi:hypothetical protein ABH935_008304 [Catenulispora sp. GAS73]|uniref:glycosyl hydrolase n=1 Tax=Catenulispora sp. GAS73 TaxID=3156269 RepID=UPI0035162156